MHKLSCDPFLAIAPDRATILARDSFLVVPKHSNHFVLFVKKGDPGLKFGNQKQVLMGVSIRGKTETLDGLEVFSIHGEILQGMVRAIANNYGRFPARAVINPDAMGRVELPLAFARATKEGFPVPIFVVTMGRERAIAQNASVAPQKHGAI